MNGWNSPISGRRSNAPNGAVSRRWCSCCCWDRAPCSIGPWSSPTSRFSPTAWTRSLSPRPPGNQPAAAKARKAPAALAIRIGASRAAHGEPVRARAASGNARAGRRSELRRSRPRSGGYTRSGYRPAGSRPAHCPARPRRRERRSGRDRDFASRQDRRAARSRAVADGQDGHYRRPLAGACGRRFGPRRDVGRRDRAADLDGVAAGRARRGARAPRPGAQGLADSARSATCSGSPTTP